jgi:CHAT domain
MELGMMLDSNGAVGLAVLNCCDSGRGGGGFLSVGATLVNSGVPLAVAMQFAITDGAAARFAGQFYSSLTAGHSVEQALTIARQFIRLQSNVEWGIPVLYTRTGSCVLFEVGAADQVARRPAPESPVIARASANRAQAREELRRLFA